MLARRAVLHDTIPVLGNNLSRRAYSQLVRPLWCASLQPSAPRRTAPTVTPACRFAPVRSPIQALRHASSGPDESLAKTPLYDLHVQHGGKMVEFGGYAMPVQYSDLSIVDSHNWTREKASLFDVSHMVQHHISGPGAVGFLSRITPSSIDSLEAHRSTLSCLLHPKTGGIVDDTIITRLKPELFYVVTNAGCRQKDFEYLTSQADTWNKDQDKHVKIEQLPDHGLIALQGPLAPSILQSLLADPSSTNLQDIYFGQSAYLPLRLPSGETTTALASRGGYTGEDGFELSIPSSSATVQVTQALVDTAGPDKLRLAGLGARDSLRLEAGMCLYGHDLDDTTTPVEAGLSWVIGKDRRAAGGFHGAETILAQLKPKKDGGSGITRRRVGLVVEGAPAREGAEIVDGEGKSVGRVTSGCPSPTLKKNIAMGYVRSGMHKAGTELAAVVRGKKRRATVTKMPFVASKYWKGGQSPA